MLKLLIQLKQRINCLEKEIVLNRKAIELLQVPTNFLGNDEIPTNLKFSLPIGTMEDLVEVENSLKSKEEHKLTMVI